MPRCSGFSRCGRACATRARPIRPVAMSDPGDRVRGSTGTRHRSRSAGHLGAGPGEAPCLNVHDRAARPVLAGGGHRIRVRAARRRRGRRHAPGVLPGRLPAPGRGGGAPGRGRGARHGPRAGRHRRGRGAAAGRAGAFAGLRRRRLPAGRGARSGAPLGSGGGAGAAAAAVLLPVRGRRLGRAERPAAAEADDGRAGTAQPRARGGLRPGRPAARGAAHAGPDAAAWNRSPASRRTGWSGCTASPGRRRKAGSTRATSSRSAPRRPWCGCGRSPASGRSTAP